MKIERETILSLRLLTFIILFSYIWPALLGNAAHHLYHHFRDQRRSHNISCVLHALDEELHETSSFASQGEANCSEPQCSFLLALHQFEPQNIRLEKPHAITTVLIDGFVVQAQETVYFNQFKVFSGRPRAPPALPLG